MGIKNLFLRPCFTCGLDQVSRAGACGICVHCYRSLPTKFFSLLAYLSASHFPADIAHVLGLSLRPTFGVAYIALLLKEKF